MCVAILEHSGMATLFIFAPSKRFIYDSFCNISDICPAADNNML